MNETVTKALCGAIAVIGISAVSVFAADKVLEDVDFTIKLNDRTLSLSSDIVTVDNSTYLPVRALCEEVLGMEVEWDAETETISLWNIDHGNANGTHEDPIAKGSPVTGEIKSGKNYIPYTLVVTEVVRGQTAYDWAKNQYKAEKPFDAGSSTGSALTEKKAKYNDTVNTYMEEKLVGDSKLYELLRAKIKFTVSESTVDFSYKTAVNDFTPYCGSVKVNGLDRQFVQYTKISPEMQDEVSYAGRTILTNGIYEGYILFRVYKEDGRPRVEYKDGQYLALY